MSEMRGEKSKGGFTLLELLIYIGLFAIIVSLSIFIVQQILKSNDRNRGRVEVEEEGNFIIRKIQWALSGAGNINEPLSNTTSSVLSISKFNFSANPVVFRVATGTLTMTKEGSPAVLLTSNTVSVEDFFIYTAPTLGGTATSVILTASIVSKIPGVPASTTIQNTFYLRK